MSLAERALAIPEQVTVAFRRGVLAFRHDRRGPWGETPKLRTERMSVGTRRFTLISFQGGEWEIHEIGLDGYSETFLGYAPDAIRALTRRS